MCPFGYPIHDLVIQFGLYKHVVDIWPVYCQGLFHKYTWPGSNWRPSACEADVIATRPQVPVKTDDRHKGVGRRKAPPKDMDLDDTRAGSTLRSSRAVPHPSTNRALRRLTSEVGRDPVHSTRYGRQRRQSAQYNGSGFNTVCADTTGYSVKKRPA